MGLDLILQGGEVLTPDGFRRVDLPLSGGRIALPGGGRRIDLGGYLILPGMVDLHGDGFERHLAPRRGAMRNLSEGLASVDAELGANGITTAYLAQFFSWEGGMRGPDFADRLIDALQSGGGWLTDMRLQLRLEMNLLEDYPRFEAMVERANAGFVVFNDHLPHAALAKGKRPPRLTGQALKSGRSPEAHLALLQSLHARSADVPEAAAALAARLAARGVLLGSHDDNTAAQRAGWHARGVRLAEFPETAEAAGQAQADGDPVVLGAPNLVRGGSHKGNVSVSDLLAQGIGSALASDYHYPSLRQAVFRLVDAGQRELDQAWALVSSGPARMMGLADRGDLAPGKRADLVVIDPRTRRIGATLCAGRISFMSGDVAARFAA